MKKRIAINGLGRIGKCILQALFENEEYRKNLEITMINAPSSLDQYIQLIKYDSVHGKFNHSVTTDGTHLIIDGHKILKTSHREIAEVSWDNVDIVIEATGKFNNRAQAGKHLDAGTKKVIITAPCKDADFTAIYGINHEQLTDIHKIISVGSCTTNCLAPIARLFDKEIGIEKGFVTTIHSYTNDQNLLDGAHKDIRRARACNLSMIPTTTGAAKTIGQVLPELDGKLDGSAIRVPTPNVSLIDFTFLSSRATSKDEVNLIAATEAKNDKYQIFGFAKEELVSIDYNHTDYSCVFDPFETRVQQSNLVRILAWYDNEWAYALRVLDVACYLAKNSLC